MNTKSTGLVPCPGWPKSYDCGALVRPGRRCRFCERVYRDHGNNVAAALSEQNRIDQKQGARND